MSRSRKKSAPDRYRRLRKAVRHATHFRMKGKALDKFLLKTKQGIAGFVEEK